MERTIISVLEQQYPQLEYIIQDGGSTGETRRILEQYRSRLTYFESCPDAGQAHAINLGFRHATGEIMAWLNADDLLLTGAVAAVATYFRDHPDVDVVYGQRITIDAQDREIGRWIIAPNAETMLPWVNYVPQETVFWRRRIWDKIGGSVDEAYHFDVDWELWLRFYRAGAAFARLPRFLGAFRFHEEQKTAVLDELGKQEAQCLHRQYHGRPVEWLEIRYQVRHYLLRCSWQYLLYYLRARSL